MEKISNDITGREKINIYLFTTYLLDLTQDFLDWKTCAIYAKQIFIIDVFRRKTSFHIPDVEKSFWLAKNIEPSFIGEMNLELELEDRVIFTPSLFEHYPYVGEYG